MKLILSDNYLKNFVKDINKVQLSDNHKFICKRLLSTDHNDIKHIMFFKQLQKIILDIPFIILSIKKGYIKDKQQNSKNSSDNMVYYEYEYPYNNNNVKDIPDYYFYPLVCDSKDKTI